MAKRKDSDSPEGKQASALESALAGGVEGGTLGFAGELAGASTAFETDPALMEFNPMAASDEDIKRAREPVVDKYKARKQALDSYLARVESDNPGAFLGGNIAGGVASSLLTPVSPVADLAINAIGTSEADLTKGDVGGLTEDVAANIALGKAGEKAIKAVGGSHALKSGKQRLGDLVSKIKGKVPTAQEETTLIRSIPNTAPSSPYIDPFEQALKQSEDEVRLFEALEDKRQKIDRDRAIERLKKLQTMEKPTWSSSSVPSAAEDVAAGRVLEEPLSIDDKINLRQNKSDQEQRLKELRNLFKKAS